MASTAGEEPVIGPPFNVLFVGAGGIAFGNEWVRWNHSAQLERYLGRRLQVLGIVDPSRERFDWVMEQKRICPAKDSYASTRHFKDVQEAADELKCGGDDGTAKPTGTDEVDLIMLVAPPMFRGSLSPGKDLEAQLLTAFGNSPTIFAEKPVTMSSASDTYAVARQLGSSGNIVAVGYMLRYLKVVQKAAQIIHDNKLTVMSVSARYVMAYSRTRKVDWWNKEKQGGPIVEQATHFCDLCRYLGGEVVMDSVRAVALEHDEPAGKLSYFTDAIHEETILPENRNPRVTSAFW
jgi:predicted dehydrogenase